jgi:hypothetical protein
MRKTTAEKIQAEKDRKQQIENGIRKLQQQQRAEERKARTKQGLTLPVIGIFPVLTQIMFIKKSL